MTRIDLDLDDMLEGFTRDGMKRFVKKLLAASDAEERRLLSKIGPAKNDLADLDEEMHGRPNTPKVEDDDLSDDDDDELPPVPKKRKS
jgi:hypothetical protein